MRIKCELSKPRSRQGGRGYNYFAVSNYGYDSERVYRGVDYQKFGDYAPRSLCNHRIGYAGAAIIIFKAGKDLLPNTFGAYEILRKMQKK